MKNLKPQEKAIMGIIQDAIVWRRVSDKMFDIVNAFNPGKAEDYELDIHHLGCENAFYLMDIKDNMDLCSELSELFYNLTEDEEPANVLAQTIYIEWLVCIKNYCSTLKTVA